MNPFEGAEVDKYGKKAVDLIFLIVPIIVCSAEMQQNEQLTKK